MKPIIEPGQMTEQEIDAVNNDMWQGVLVINLVGAAAIVGILNLVGAY